MKTCPFVIFILSNLFSFCQTDSLVSRGNTNLLMSPKGYTQLHLATGFLNNDDIQDFAMIVQSQDTNNIEIDSVSNDTINLNPRILAIYFGDDKGYFHKEIQVNRFILLRHMFAMNEPIADFSITKNERLKIQFSFFDPASSWTISNGTYHFKYQNDSFELINYQSSSLHRATMETVETSFDFLKGKKEKIITTLDSESKESIEKDVQRFKLKNLKSLKELQKPFYWEFMGSLI